MSSTTGGCECLKSETVSIHSWADSGLTVHRLWGSLWVNGTLIHLEYHVSWHKNDLISAYTGVLPWTILFNYSILYTYIQYLFSFNIDTSTYLGCMLTVKQHERWSAHWSHWFLKTGFSSQLTSLFFSFGCITFYPTTTPHHALFSQLNVVWRFKCCSLRSSASMKCWIQVRRSSL